MSRFGWAYVNGIPTGSSAVANGPTGSLQFHSASQLLSGSSNLTFNSSTNKLTLLGQLTGSSLVVSASVVSASTYLGITAGGTPGGANKQIQFNSGSTFSGSQNLTYDYSTGQMTLTGTMVVSGTLYANEYYTNVISSSIIYSSGSTKFGDDAADTHQFTGSILGDVVSGTIARFTTITGSNITGTFAGNGSGLTSLTASNITNFTNDVRNQFSAGTGIVINAGAISASNIPNSSLQNSAIALGTTTISLGATGSTIQGLTALTASNITGTTAQFTTISGSNISSSTSLLIGGATTIGGNLTVNGGQTSVQSFTASAGISGTIAQFTNITASAISSSGVNSAFAFATFDNISVTAGAINATIGNTTPSTGKFTTLSASSAITGSSISSSTSLLVGSTATIGGNLTVNGGQTSVQSFTASAGISGSGGLQVGGNGLIGGTLIVSGNTTLGDASTDVTRINAQLTSSGGIVLSSAPFSFSYLNVTTNFTMTTASCIIGVSASSPLTITLPSASATTEGRYFIIKDEAGNSSTNIITISCSVGSGDTIDNLSSSVINVNKGSYTIYRGGTNKYYIV